MWPDDAEALPSGQRAPVGDERVLGRARLNPPGPSDARARAMRLLVKSADDSRRNAPFSEGRGVSCIPSLPLCVGGAHDASHARMSLSPRDRSKN